MAVKEQKDATYEEIIRSVRANDLSPVYYLMGEEPYYIDKVSDYIVDTVLKPEEKDFNLTILYGDQELKMGAVVDAARRYPVMAERQVVLVREAQNVDDKELLADYLDSPQKTTVLIFCHKKGVLDRRKKWVEIIRKKGILYESKLLNEKGVLSFIVAYFKRKSFQIEPQAAIILAEFIGNDLCRLSGEMDKLMIALADGRALVTTDDVKMRVGMNKDFNNFELLDALIQKDLYKANLIVKYYNETPKSFSLTQTLGVLFSFYSKLMQAYYAPQKTEEGIAAWLEISRWQVVKNIMPAMRVYTGVKVMQIIHELRKIDAISKGAEGTINVSDGKLLQELVFNILH